MRCRALAAAVIVTSALAVPTRAQDGDGLASLLLRFFSPTRPIVLQEAQAPFNHATHFSSQPNAQGILRELNRGIATQISTFPLGSSSPGFTYTFDASAGVFNRSAESFGPVFTERPLTAGKNKFSFGISNLRASYDSFDGQKLREDDLQLYLTHQDASNDGSTNPWFEGDIIRADLSIDITAHTTVLFANYGVTDRLDVGVAVPLQSIDLDARIRTTVDRVATATDPFVVHSFAGGGDSADFLETGDASGLGDIVVRGKYNFLRRPSLGLALGGDLRLPTGKEEDLLGSGATQAKLYLIAGGATGRFSPRASAGYTFSSGGGEFTGDLPNEASYSAGFDLAVHNRVTFTADFLGRTLFDTGRIVERDQTFAYSLRPPSTVTGTVNRQTVVAETGDLTLLLAAANLKINLVGRLLLNAGALFGLGDSGLQDTVTPVFGIDYSF